MCLRPNPWIDFNEVLYTGSLFGCEFSVEFFNPLSWDEDDFILKKIRIVWKIPRRFVK